MNSWTFQVVINISKEIETPFIGQKNKIIVYSKFINNNIYITLFSAKKRIFIEFSFIMPGELC